MCPNQSVKYELTVISVLKGYPDILYGDALTEKCSEFEFNASIICNPIFSTALAQFSS